MNNNKSKRKELELLQEVAMTSWKKVSKQYNNLPQDFMIKYREYIDWEVASITQTLTEETIEVLQEYFEWSNIGGFQKVSLDFVWKHRDKITNWYSVFECLEVNLDFALNLVEDMGIEILKEISIKDIKE